MLDARAQYPTSTLADLYEPLTMPAQVLKAHQELDRAPDRCYRPEPFPSDRHRVEYLFALYEQLTAPWSPPPSPPTKGGDCNRRHKSCLKLQEQFRQSRRVPFWT